MSSAATLTAITALAAELCDPHQHVEPIVDRDPADRRHRRRRVWVTVQPGLILQLRQAAESHVGGRTERDGTSVPDSRPPGGWEALARLNEISTAVNEWCRSLNLPIQDTQDTPEGGIRALAAAAPHLDDTTAWILVQRQHVIGPWRPWQPDALMETTR
jgi:hypothetical protein